MHRFFRHCKEFFTGDWEDTESAEKLKKLEETELRDTFAAQAVSHIAHDAARYGWPEEILTDAAEYAYKIADAMMKARAKPFDFVEQAEKTP